MAAGRRADPPRPPSPPEPALRPRTPAPAAVRSRSAAASLADVQGGAAPALPSEGESRVEEYTRLVPDLILRNARLFDGSVADLAAEGGRWTRIGADLDLDA